MLNITNVDPVDLDLYFERFINLHRQSPPDFNIDFSWRDRPRVTEYIFNRFSNTSLLGACNTFQDRSAIREIGKVFGLPKLEIDDLINKEIALQAARERGAGTKTYKSLSAQIRAAKQSVAELEAQTKSLSEQTGQFNEESRKAAATVIGMALGRLRATGMADFLGAEVTELEALRKELLSGAISIEEFNKRLEATDDRSAKFVAGVQAAAQNASNLSKEFLNLGDKPATAFSKIRDEAAGIANELAETGQQGEAGFKSVKGQEKSIIFLPLILGSPANVVSSMSNPTFAPASLRAAFSAPETAACAVSKVCRISFS